MRIDKTINRSLKIIFLITFTCACSIAPRPINYGSDACHYCKMTIVDKQHAAQIVSQKGKSFKYDAIECMMNDINRRDVMSIAEFLVADYNNPGKLLDARKAHFLISKAIKSPMGEFLSAFSSEQLVREKVGLLGGKYFSWQTLRQEFE